MLVTFKRHEDGKLMFSGNMNYLLKLIHLFTLISSVTGGRSHQYYSPRFNDRPKNITTFIGDTAILYCSVVNLGTKTVIWRKVPSRHPLTVGTFTFISDKSYSVHRQSEKNEWNLIIKNVQPKHAGLYECHISTKDEQKFNVFLNVVATTHNTRRGIGADRGTRTNDDKKQQKTSKSSKCSASSARWWLVFGLMSLLYLNGATVLGP